MEEETTVPEEELVEGELEAGAPELDAPELGEPVYAEDDPELEDESDPNLEDDTEHAFNVKVFFHTGTVLDIEANYLTSITDLRKTLEKGGRPTYGSTVLRNGMSIAVDYEAQTFLAPGDMIVFSGSVKGG